MLVTTLVPELGASVRLAGAI